jgi:phosphonoacetaldehyde hydrolase
MVLNKIQAVIFDWAGTTVDFGSLAPVAVFREIFRQQAVDITLAEAREPMGRGKLEHIAAVAAMPRVRTAWERVHGTEPTEADILQMYQAFLPLQKETLANYADLIPGLINTITWLRVHDIRIGSTTGYTRELMEVLSTVVRERGFSPDNIVCSDDVHKGRPAPWMLLRSAEQLDAYPFSQVVAVDDTPVGIQAGRAAGSWTVAVAATGNALGLSLAEFNSLTDEERNQQLLSAREKFSACKPDFIIDSVAELPAVIEKIEDSTARYRLQ